MNGRLYFTADDSIHGTELWSSDGTAAGTRLVRDINTAPRVSSGVRDLTPLNGTLFLVADDGYSGLEVWRSDGSAMGTNLLKDISSEDSNDNLPRELTAVDNLLFFVAGDENGVQVWKSDGTSQGTKVIVIPHHELDWPDSLTAVGDQLFFLSRGETSPNRDLWQSDGTAEGTISITNVFPDFDGYDIWLITNGGGRLFFVATGEYSGQEVWAKVVSLTRTSPEHLKLDIGGTAVTYQLALNRPPSSPVMAALESGPDIQIQPHQVTFTPANWNISQTITVRAVPNDLPESTYTTVITHSFTSSDTIYNGVTTELPLTVRAVRYLYAPVVARH
jgi:ELWxxDGT repeat protein